MKTGGYFTAIRGKVSHSTPHTPYGWDLVLDTLPDGKKAHVKDAASYGVSTAHGIRAADEAGKPFCLLVNISDPHKPFYAQNNKTGETIDDPHVPTRIFTPEEVPVPGFLSDDPAVRKELSHYYSSVRRADDCVGEVLAAVDGSGHAADTLVLFLSDHGMPLPFAKTQVYHHSTHTPLLVRWPGVTRPGSVDDTHMVSAVDFLPTLLDVCGLGHPKGLDGHSFAPVLRGESQPGRDYVIKEYNENSGASRDPMRAIQSREYLYIFNPWSNGERIFATATTGTPTYRRMAELAKTDPSLAARLDLYQHRVPEELYDVVNDPDCLHNLIDDPAHRDDLVPLLAGLESAMNASGDPLLSVFQNRDDAVAREEYVQKVEREALDRRAQRRKEQSGANAKLRRNRSQKLISLRIPDRISAGDTVTIQVRHTLPPDLGEQKLHVTLKGGPKASRIARQVLTATGIGTVNVTFEIPSGQQEPMRFAAFVGEDYDKHLQHIQSKAFSLQ
jgi:N-sulfoglucosamine sulfohydrolase